MEAPAGGSPRPLHVRWLGTVRYHDAQALQHGLLAEAVDDHLLLLEHPHVYTLGVRADPAHVLVEPAAVGAELIRTDRGGDVTYLDLVARYRVMAESLGLQGHIAWAAVMRPR